LNATTSIEIIGGAPADLEKLTFNGQDLEFDQSSIGVVTATVEFNSPEIKLPCFSQLKWKKTDSLPEISEGYDDTDWVDADYKTSPNDKIAILTPVSLYAGDYGFHTGSVIYRGHFTANGNESTLKLTLQGGRAFGSSVWINSTFVGSWVGEPNVLVFPEPNGTVTLDLPSKLERGTDYIFTIVLDHMGLNGNYVIGEDNLKSPRGILEYELSGHDAGDIRWKITGNLGGEDYADLVRGPLNEGGMFAERQGFHQPSPPSEKWDEGKPTEGVTEPGITFYTTTFDLDLPKGYDIPLSIKLDRDVSAGAFRAQIYVNGYQFGKFIPHIGPQSRYPIPEGILNHHGSNTIGLTLWALEEGGARIQGLGWHVSMITETGFGDVELAPAPKWKQRDGAY
jgi:hypothetical protein